MCRFARRKSVEGAEEEKLREEHFNKEEVNNEHYKIFKKFIFFTVCQILLGQAVARLVEALRYKPKGRGFDSRWCQWNFSLT